MSNTTIESDSTIWIRREVRRVLKEYVDHLEPEKLTFSLYILTLDSKETTKVEVAKFLYTKKYGFNIKTFTESTLHFLSMRKIGDINQALFDEYGHLDDTYFTLNYVGYSFAEYDVLGKLNHSLNKEFQDEYQD